MRPVAGFLILHLLFGVVGLVGLTAIGTVDVRRRPSAGWAAAGPAVLLGMIVVLATAVLALIAGIPVSGLAIIVIAGAWSLGLAGVARHRAAREVVGAPPAGTSPPQERWITRGIAAAGALYLVGGMVALAQIPTRGDDARIWSLRGLTLFYYPHLKSEIFLNPLQAGAHPVYPLLQPLLEGNLSRFMGSPQLRFYHAELWLMFGLVLWTAGYLILGRFPGIGRRAPVWIAGIALLGLTPHVVHNLVVGDADTLGSALLGAGVVALALWLERPSAALAVIAAVLLCGAASTKDEDLTASALALVIVGGWAGYQAIFRRGRPDPTRALRQLLPAMALYAVPVLGWRLWLSAHHLSDSVQPPLPRALSPVYVLGRTAQMRWTADTMLAQIDLHWNGVVALFLVVCVLCLRRRIAHRAALLYLAVFGATVLTLLWLYTTTPLNLGFLLLTSMDRTVSVFMAPAALAIGHLLMELVAGRGGASPALE